SSLSSVAYPSFFTDIAPTEIYTLSLHDALPILAQKGVRGEGVNSCPPGLLPRGLPQPASTGVPALGRLEHVRPLFTDQPAQHERSEEHTSELQSRENLVCRLLLEKKKTTKNNRQ